jgi:3-oxoacyl-(acyl-carrier-protein) synthase
LSSSAATSLDFDPTGWMTAKMSRRVDPYIAYLVVAAKKALHDAGIAEGSDKMCVRSRACIICAAVRIMRPACMLMLRLLA